nr:MAG TPA: hypothetical protein [Caudoviricetes sp.]
MFFPTLVGLVILYLFHVIQNYFFISKVAPFAHNLFGKNLTYSQLFLLLHTLLHTFCIKKILYKKYCFF